ncbi:MAG: RNA polymerase sigma-70 factor [Carboxylicivirga sp.]|jgi:RNA polymerase sigma-70 factor (ECF subfamily)|nr:RNA polymerase sigma-70 factor [Carboxylicivirga sp.]
MVGSSSVQSTVINEISKGNKSVFANYFHNTYGRLIYYAGLHIKDQAVADDIVQEAFINLWNQRSKLDAKQSLDAYVFKLVRNRCVNFLRDEAIHHKHLRNWKDEALQHVSQYDLLGFEEKTVQEILLAELDMAIENLPDKCRRAFILNKLEGKKQAEIAAEMNISVKMVEKHIASAKSKLKEHLIDKFPMYTLLIYFLIE